MEICNLILNGLFYFSIPLVVRLLVLRRPFKKRWTAILLLFVLFLVIGGSVTELKESEIVELKGSYGLSPHIYTGRFGSPLLIGALFVSYYILRYKTRE